MPVTPIVVVIEDHTELGHVLRDVMSEDGYEVLAVRDQFAAVATLRKQRVDLVIADLPDPDPSVADPLSEIARDFPQIPLIVLSDDDGDRAPFFGPWRISESRVTLRRPFKLDDLLTVSREVVG